MLHGLPRRADRAGNNVGFPPFHPWKESAFLPAFCPLGVVAEDGYATTGALCTNGSSSACCFCPLGVVAEGG